MKGLIYIFEQNPELLELLSIALTTRDFTVRASSSGGDAMEMLKQEAPSAVITSLMLPELNGYELINRIRTNPVTEKIPIILITSLTKNSLKSDREWADSVGVEGFFTEPVEPIDVVQFLIKLLEQRESSPRQST